MTEPYTPNPSQLHEQISCLTDDDRQRALSYNPALQELADNEAYTRALTLGRIGTQSDMQATTGVVVGDIFIVRTLGIFYYHPLLDSSAGDMPWIFAATGMGVGVWVHTMFDSLFGSSKPAKLLTSLLPVIPANLRPEVHPYIVALDNFEIANFVSPRQSLTGNEWTALNNGIVDLSASIIVVSPGDRVNFSIGPLKAYIIDTDVSKQLVLRAAITDGVSPQVTKYYPVHTSINDKQCISWSFQHVVSYGPLTIQLFGYSNGAYVMHPEQNGASTFQWGHYVAIRKPV